MPRHESVSDRLVRLPFYFDLTEAEQAQVIEAVQASGPAANLPS